MELEIYVKLSIAFLCAGLSFWRMMVIQRRKEQIATEKFEQLMKAFEEKAKREKKQNVPQKSDEGN